MTLRQAVSAFQRWAEPYPMPQRSGEWECDYPAWEALYTSVNTFLRSSAPSQWNEDDIDDLLYAIARDNEMDTLLKK